MVSMFAMTILARAIMADAGSRGESANTPPRLRPGGAHGGRMQRFTDLKVWQRAHALALEVYRLTVDFPARSASA